MTSNIHDSRGLRIAVLTAVALVVFYSLSLAPVQWMQGQGYVGGSEWRDLSVYTPITVIADHSPDFIEQTINRYAAWMYRPYRTHGGVI